MAKALLNQTTLREGMDKILKKCRASPSRSNQNGQWANVSTLSIPQRLNLMPSPRQIEPKNQAGNLDQGLANLAEPLGLQPPQINGSIEN